MPKVSVIVPNYNHALFLEQRLRSVLHQTYGDFEVIYLGDASTDHSQQVFDQFAHHPKIKAIFNSVNSGSPFHQWHQGIQQAQGEYLWIAESDDYADPTLLEKLVAKLDQLPQVGLAYCQSWQVSQGVVETTLAAWTEEFGDRWQQDFVSHGRDECRQYLLFKNTIPNASAVVFRRSLYEAVGGVDRTMRLCGDWLLWTKLLLVSDLAFVREPLNYFRSHSTNTRIQVSKAALDLEEHLQITRLLCQSLEISEAALLRRIDDVLERWAYYLITVEFPWNRSAALYRALGQLSSTPAYHWRLHQKLCQQLWRVLRYRLSLGTRLKGVWASSKV